MSIYWHDVRDMALQSIFHVMLSSTRGQAIIWTDVKLISIGPLGTHLSGIHIKTIFNQENVLQNMVCKMSTILYRRQCFKSTHLTFNKTSSAIYKTSIVLPFPAVIHTCLWSHFTVYICQCFQSTRISACIYKNITFVMRLRPIYDCF